MRIAVDVMGGDHGCGVIIAGVIQALQANRRIEEVFLAGNESEILEALEMQKCGDSRITVHPASEVFTMEDKPIEAIRRKKDSSMLRAIELVRDGRADAIVSPGNTGALMAASTIKLRTLPAVDRVAIATVMPSRDGQFILLDAGANLECKPLNLAQFAIMGSIYSRDILGHARPRVGILSNGTEAIKGTEFTREALRLCEELELNFIGHVEGHDLFCDRVEVVVTDGFTGNIVLKSCESLARAIKSALKSELTANPLRRLGASIARGAFRGLKDRFDADACGGAPLLGLNGCVIKAHGSSTETAIMNAVRVAGESAQHKINETIQMEVSRANDRLAGPGAAI